MSNSPIMEVIDYAHEQGLCIKDDRFNDFILQKPYLFARLTGLRYSSFQNLYEYLEGRTTFSTQHKIKGREFERVLVVLDAGGWNNYNFNYLFENGGNESVRERTSKLLRVLYESEGSPGSVFPQSQPGCTRSSRELVREGKYESDHLVTDARTVRSCR